MTPNKDQRISFETAKLAKEKGFNWPVKFHYQISITEREHPEDGKSGPFGWEKGELSLQGGYHVNNHPDFDGSTEAWVMYAAPTQQYLQRWLREVHGIHIEVLLSANKPYTEFYYRAMKIGQYFSLSHDGVYRDTYEEVLEYALMKVLSKEI